MIFSETNLKKWYDEYRQQLVRSAKYIESSRIKGKIRDNFKPLTEAQFKYDIISVSSDMPSVKSGKVLAQIMAKQEVYPLSYAQALRHARAHAKLTGEKPTIDLINRYRSKSEDYVFKSIRTRREELFHEGKTSREVWMEIGQQYYGSDVT